MGGNVLKQLVLMTVALGGAGTVTAQEPAPVAAQQTAAAGQPAAPGEPKALAGMSILGNQEAPKSLVIVPWKSSEIGNGIGVSRALDTRIRAVDKDVFMRELKYHAIRSGAQK
jgi:hypothetical protein